LLLKDIKPWQKRNKLKEFKGNPARTKGLPFVWLKEY